MSETNDDAAAREPSLVRCFCCEKAQFNSSVPEHDLLADGWVPVGKYLEDWLCPECTKETEAEELSDLAEEYGMSWRQGVALEYVRRAGQKPGLSRADDLRKAVATLEYEIARLEAKEQ